MTIIPREPFDARCLVLGTIRFARKAGMTTRQLNRIRSAINPTRSIEGMVPAWPADTANHGVDGV